MKVEDTEDESKEKRMSSNDTKNNYLIKMPKRLYRITSKKENQISCRIKLKPVQHINHVAEQDDELQ